MLMGNFADFFERKTLMVSKRPEAYSTLDLAARKRLMAHRAKVYMAVPDYWFSKFQIV